MRQVRRAVVVLVTLALAWLPGAASAGVLTHHDPAGDVARSAVGSNVYAADPAQVAGDIVMTRVVHARLAIWIQVRFRDLVDRGNGNFHLVGIKTRWRSRTIELDALPGHWEGSTRMTDAHGRPVACAVTHRISYERDRVMLRVPRSCLGAPPWVRVGIRSTVAGTTFAYADDARTTGLASGLQSSLAYGRRIRL